MSDRDLYNFSPLFSMSIKENVIEKIQQKKEFKYLDNSFIAEILSNYIKKYNLKLENLKEKEIKILVKEIRAKLRLYTGRFQVSLKKRLQLLEQNKINELLSTHFSTAERLDFYPKLKQLMKSLKIKSILDLACGLNPIAIANQEIEFYASDIDKENLILVEIFFKKNKIQGKTFVCDIRKIKDNLPEIDLTLLLKILDILEKPYEVTEILIEKIKSKYFLISFATKTLSGKPMKNPRRFWLERLLNTKKLVYQVFSSKNEIFYLIEKGQDKVTKQSIKISKEVLRLHLLLF